MNLPVPITYEGSPLRTVTVDGDLWFSVPDACVILELTNPTMAVGRLDPRDIRRSDGLSSTDPIANRDNPFIVMDSLGRWQAPNWVNESGLYDLIFESRKPEARAFGRWITSEVLPQIRRTGQYVPAPAAPEYELGKPTERLMAGSMVTFTREADGMWTDASSVFFLFNFHTSAELAAWLPEDERRCVRVPHGGGFMDFWEISEAGLNRLLSERQPAPHQSTGASLAHDALRQWADDGCPALPAPGGLADALRAVAAPVSRPQLGT